MSTLYVYTENDLNRFVAPRLLAAPIQYDHRFLDQYTNVLRLYFNQLDAFNSQLRTTTVSPNADGTNIYFPHGQFSSTLTQTAANTTTSYNVTFDTTEATLDFSVVSGYQITAAKKGRYNIQFSIQFTNQANSTESADVWFRKNGTDIPRSNSRFGLVARKTPSIPSYCIGTVNTLVDLDAGENVSLRWATSNTLVEITSGAAGGSPTQPAIPSVILTATFVSKI